MSILIAANWKMHKKRAEARATASALAKALQEEPLVNREVLIFPPFTALEATGGGLWEGDPHHKIRLGGQDAYPARQGAFTGEISPDMLIDLGCTWLLTGHSERRHTIGESGTLVGEKTAFALREGLSVMLCIGETLEERDQRDAILRQQLQEGLSGVNANTFPRVAVAYEPVWAIGTGKVASPDDVLSAHAFVRETLGTLFGAAASETRILYGGSVKADNAATLLELDNVNGLLVGGASLEAETFVRILRAGQAD